MILTMVLKSKCLNCNQYYKKVAHCKMTCSRKGKEKITPTKFTMKNIKISIENNIGCHINIANISIYQREIKNLIN